MSRHIESDSNRRGPADPGVRLRRQPEGVERALTAAASSSRIPHLIYWALIAITAANYSFISFTLAGEEILASPLKPIAYARLPLAMIGLLWLVAVHRRGPALGASAGPVLLLCFCAASSVPFSPDIKQAAISGTWFIFQLLFLAKYAYYVADTSGLAAAKQKLVMPIMLMGAYFLLLTLARVPDFALGRPFPAYFTTYAHVAMLAPLVLGGVACCFREVATRRVLPVVLIGLAAFGFLVIMVSGKRASISSAAIILCAYYVFRTRGAAKVACLVLGVVLVATVVYTEMRTTAIVASEYTMMRIERGLNEQANTSLEDRYDIWRDVGELSASYPLGTGLNVGRELVGRGLHNTYLGYLLELGWLALLTVLVSIAWSAAAALGSRDSHKRDVLFFIFAPCVLYGITEYNTTPGQMLYIPFWVGLLYGLLPGSTAGAAARYPTRAMATPESPPQPRFRGTDGVRLRIKRRERR